MPVQTARVQGRRVLDYASFEELLADAERLTSIPVKTLGNWSQGQIYKHIALMITGSIDGLPMRFPWLFRIMVKLMKKKLLKGQMPAGFQLKPEPAKTMVPPPIPAEQALADLRAAVARFQSEPHRIKHPLLGHLTPDEWNTIQLKHASMHMSFLVTT